MTPNFAITFWVAIVSSLRPHLTENLSFLQMHLTLVSWKSFYFKTFFVHFKPHSWLWILLVRDCHCVSNTCNCNDKDADSLMHHSQAWLHSHWECPVNTQVHFIGFVKGTDQGHTQALSQSTWGYATNHGYPLWEYLTQCKLGYEICTFNITDQCDFLPMLWIYRYVRVCAHTRLFLAWIGGTVHARLNTSKLRPPSA